MRRFKLAETIIICWKLSFIFINTICVCYATFTSINSMYVSKSPLYLTAEELLFE